ncbi:MAG: 2-C-methyl-D-erythritol 4-phosphate cytidylyltransferase [Acidimicrobiales bacterium]
MRVAAIVTAAGSGTRMGTQKQFLELTSGERLIDRVVAACRATTGWVGVIVPPGSGWEGPMVDAVIEGGSSRFASIAAGMAAVPPEAEVVVVHSASHPLASVDLIRRLVAVVDGGAEGAVPFVAAVDVIKRRHYDATLTTVGRDGLGAAQCPMAFSRSVLDRALSEVVDAIEESQAVEAVGGTLAAVEGEVANLHVTDLASLAVVRHLATLASTIPPTGPGRP